MVLGTYRLSFWEEYVGVLHKLRIENGSLIALIGKISLVLPLEMEENMRPHLGKRLSVLHTDTNTPYLFRVVSDQEMSVEAIDEPLTDCELSEGD